MLIYPQTLHKFKDWDERHDLGETRYLPLLVFVFGEQDLSCGLVQYDPRWGTDIRGRGLKYKLSVHLDQHLLRAGSLIDILTRWIVSVTGRCHISHIGLSFLTFSDELLLSPRPSRRVRRSSVLFRGRRHLLFLFHSGLMADSRSKYYFFDAVGTVLDCMRCWPLAFNYSYWGHRGLNRCELWGMGGVLLVWLIEVFLTTSIYINLFRVFRARRVLLVLSIQALNWWFGGNRFLYRVMHRCPLASVPKEQWLEQRCRLFNTDLEPHAWVGRHVTSVGWERTLHHSGLVMIVSRSRQDYVVIALREINASAVLSPGETLV